MNKIKAIMPRYASQCNTFYDVKVHVQHNKIVLTTKRF